MSDIGTNYRDYFNNKKYTDGNSASGSGGVTLNAVFTDKEDKGVTADDFLKLMVAQLRNQDFMNPVDDTQYVTQLAQFATMEQMTELASYSKSNYVMSLVGKSVTAAKYKVNGDIERIDGVIDKISLVDNEYTLHVGDKSFTLEQVMEIKNSSAASAESGYRLDFEKKNLLMSLMGKNVTAKKVDEDGYTQGATGVVTRVDMENGEYKFYIGEKEFTLDHLVTINEDEKIPDEDSKAEPADGADKTEGGETADAGGETV